jgi:hypothetical protein
VLFGVRRKQDGYERHRKHFKTLKPCVIYDVHGKLKLCGTLYIKSNVAIGFVILVENSSYTAYCMFFIL